MGRRRWCKRDTQRRRLRASATSFEGRGKVPAAKLPAAKLPAAKLPAAKLPAAKLPAAKLPAAKLPAAKLPAAKLHRGKVPAAKLHRGNASPAMMPSGRRGTARDGGSRAVCTLWATEGVSHVATFDGEVASVSGSGPCLFSLSAEELGRFNVEPSVQVGDGEPSAIEITTDEANIHVDLQSGAVSLLGNALTLPYIGKGFFIKSYGPYTKFTAKLLGLSVVWGEEFVTVKVDKKYENTTVGLCGSYSGVREARDTVSSWVQSMNTGSCKADVYTPLADLNKQVECVARFSAFTSCTENNSPFVGLCLDAASAAASASASACASEAVYARRCLLHGFPADSWREASTCQEPSCSASFVFSDCGSPCTKTCSNPVGEVQCDESCLPGCFCPEGTVLDDYETKTCVPPTSCKCKRNGLLYNSGTVLEETSSICGCASGVWSCTSTAADAMCSLEGSTHVTTFDFNAYGFFGAGSFILLSTNGWSVQIDIADKAPDSPRLEAVFLKMNSGLLEIRSDGQVYLDDTALALPHTSDVLKIYAQTTTYMQVFTTVGLKMQVQLAPLMQLYLTVPTSMQGQTQGLCGSYNAEKADDLRTPQGIVESVAPQFVAAWSSKPLGAIIAADAGSVCRYGDRSAPSPSPSPPHRWS
ncbi:mucin-6-like [Petromyzon marinus]|uniref:mucin-6-like n=1 Tax=Petromyzon marinus TaxID=7757 RepID=UPI003F6E99CE